jgi:hypothetical protein
LARILSTFACAVALGLPAAPVAAQTAGDINRLNAAIQVCNSPMGAGMAECAKLRGTIKAIVDGTKWVIEDHKRTGRPAVANWSFIADTAGRIAALDSAVAMLREAGIPVVVSAGNVEANACKISPGNADGTIVVGASTLIRGASEDSHGNGPNYTGLHCPLSKAQNPFDALLGEDVT